MTPRIYKTSVGFDIINSDGYLFQIVGNKATKKGRVSDSFKPSGKLVKGVPNHLKAIFFELQKK